MDSFFKGLTSVLIIAPSMVIPVEPEKPLKSLRKGALVRVNRKAYTGSVESKASDQSPPEYLFQGPGELLAIKGDYGQIRWRLPVPDVWLRIDQLEDWS